MRGQEPGIDQAAQGDQDALRHDISELDRQVQQLQEEQSRMQRELRTRRTLRRGPATRASRWAAPLSILAVLAGCAALAVVVLDRFTDVFDDAAPASEAAGPAYRPYAAGDYGIGECAPAAGAAVRVMDFGAPPAACIQFDVPHTAVFDTSHGVVIVALDVTNTPGTTNSFVNLARFGYYNGTELHRSDPSIGILQGGAPHTGDANDPGPGYGIWDEGTGFRYRPGQLAMARTTAENSADAQFFFTVTKSASVLDAQGTYVVFGEVIRGLDVLQSILSSHVDDPDGELGGRPSPPVIVHSVVIETDS